jgi:DNA-binding transcriptional LysR family regulator
MEISWLEDFLAFCATSNFSRAAEIRNLTQPTFSRRIQNLEAWFGAPLIDRSTFPASLTEEGKSFRKTAEEIVHALYRGRDYSRRLTKSHRSFLSFATLHAIATSYYPKWLEAVEQKAGPLSTRVLCAPLHDCVANLTSGACDFMICYSHPSGPLALDSEKYMSLRISEDRLVPVSAPDDNGMPLFSLEKPSPDGATPYLTYAPYTFIIRVIERIISEQPQAPILEPVYECALTSALKAMAISGRGLTWMPQSLVKHELESGRLVYAGGQRWTSSMGISIYRPKALLRREAERIWNRLSASA